MVGEGCVPSWEYHALRGSLSQGHGGVSVPALSPRDSLFGLRLDGQLEGS